MNLPSVEQLKELGMLVEGEYESELDFDWSKLNIDRENAYRLMATHALELELDEDQHTARAIITKLLVENMILNIKLMEARK
jgi:hypothetical protein